jgi:hypothetical protein
MSAVRFRFELLVAVLAALAAVGTALVPDWIEVVLRVDPDTGSGAAEWAVVGALAVLALVAAALARRDLARLRSATA